MPPDKPSVHTTSHRIGQGIHRISTCMPGAAPGGLTFNQFVVEADEPLLFHTGSRATFPLTASAVADILPLDRLRWIAFGHVEADECGAMNEFLAAAPRALVAHGAIGCMTTLNDLCARTPRALANGEIIDLGGRRLRHIDTPHVPHNWEARVLFEETTRTLFCGDLFAHAGNGPPVTGDDIVDSALAFEDSFNATALSPDTVSTLRALAELSPRCLAIMHGSSFTGDGADALRRLADGYQTRLTKRCSSIAAVMGVRPTPGR